MKKKCVRWTKSVRTALVAAAAITTTMVVNPVAQTSAPSAQPRLEFTDISYLGGFRLPAESSNGDSFSIGGHPMAFNPASHSLFIGSRSGRVAEVSIPNPVNTSNVQAMSFGAYLQPFADPTEGHLKDIAPDGVGLDGLLVYGNRLYGTAAIYYDANNIQRASHYSRSLQLNEPSFQGWSQVWETGKTGFVSGMMSVVPSEWRNTLGGPAATGQCCIPIVGRTSWGPAAFSFDPTKVGQPGAVPASPLLYYTNQHPTLGVWDGSNPTYGATISMGGMAIIAGTRTVLYFGRNGLGPNCYGNGTNNKALDNTKGPDGALWCYDPTSTDKGSHAYPYRYQIWAYDLNDFAAVKAGQKQPWDVVPYGVWPFNLPTAESSVKIGGVGYDPVNQVVYISQMFADQDGYSYRPVIHMLHMNAVPGSTDGGSPLPEPTPPAPPVVTPPAPAPTNTTPNTSSNVVSAITLSVNRSAPQVAGTAVMFSAYAVGGVMPQEYKWLVDDGTGMKAVTNWSVTDTFTWTPTTAGDKYRVGVWARSNGNTNDAPEASASTAFAISAPAPVPVRSVRISADKPAPQPQGTTVKLTATVEGGSAVEYKWLLHDGGSWAAATGWTAQNTFNWTPAAANSNYRIGVWVRSNGNTRDEAEATSSEDYAISAAPVAAAPVVTAPVPVRLTAVTMTTSKPAPQVAGTAITFQATAVGGAAQYKFLVYDGSPTWTFLTGWTSQNTLTWTPPSANPNYTMRVWVRSAASTTDEWEAETRIDFPIIAAPVAPVVVPVAPAPVPAVWINSVSISTDKAAPQVAGTTIVASANVVGGSATLQYRWLIHNGSEWTVVTDWTGSKTYAWTPTAANAGHFIGVWVRNAANANGGAEVTSSVPFLVQ